MISLHHAVANGDVNAVKEALGDESVDVNDRRGIGSTTPLFEACSNGQVEITKLLLEHSDIDVNASDIDDWNPFYAACFNGNIELINLLLSHEKTYEIDVNRKSAPGSTPINLVANQGNVDMLKRLIQCPRIDINMQLALGQTVLHGPCSKGYTECVSILLSCDRLTSETYNKRNNDGFSPLCIAIYYGHVEIVKLLLKLDDIEIDILCHLFFSLNEYNFISEFNNIDNESDQYQFPILKLNYPNVNQISTHFLHLDHLRITEESVEKLKQFLIETPEISDVSFSNKNQKFDQLYRLIKDFTPFIKKLRLSDFAYSSQYRLLYLCLRHHPSIENLMILVTQLLDEDASKYLYFLLKENTTITNITIMPTKKNFRLGLPFTEKAIKIVNKAILESNSLIRFHSSRIIQTDQAKRQLKINAHLFNNGKQLRNDLDCLWYLSCTD